MATRLTDLKREKAMFAYQQIKKEPSIKKNILKDIPMFIYRNGLAATLAYLQSKDEYKKIYDIFKKYLKNNTFQVDSNNEKEIFETLLELDLKKYRLLTQDILFLCNWLIIFADEVGDGQ